MWLRCETGTGYEPVKNIEDCVSKALRVADSEDYRGLGIKSILFPLLGTGTGEGKLEEITPKLIMSALEYFKGTENSALETIYFIARTDVERNVCHNVLQKLVESDKLVAV